MSIDNKKYKPQEYLFQGQYGGKYSGESILKIVKEAATKAGIRKTITPHVLRHSSIRIWSRFKTNTSIIRA